MTTTKFRLLAGLASAALAWLGTRHPALAQAHNPFSVGISEGGGSATGLSGWLLAEQARFEQLLSGAVRASKADGSALWVLSSLSFVYGVLHAAGPGHGKAVVASYMFANERALRRGVIISFLAAALQGLVAIGLVGILALLFHATAQRMRDAAQVIESLSYAGIAVLGLWLVWHKGRGLVAAWRFERATGRMSATPSRHTQIECTAEPDGGGRLDAHVHGPGCGHFHAPHPATLGIGFSWGSAAMTVVAAGLRPCSGAILVLVFALAQGLFSVGIVATLAMSLGTAITTSGLASLAVFAGGIAVRVFGEGTPRGALVLRGIETCAGVAIFMLGSGLFFGVTTAAGA